MRTENLSSECCDQTSSSSELFPPKCPCFLLCRYCFLSAYLSVCPYVRLHLCVATLQEFIPHMAKEYGFQYELVQYKWPRWLHQQTEKQRIIWGYKILFLDVLFPLAVDKILFVDADQVRSYSAARTLLLILLLGI